MTFSPRPYQIAADEAFEHADKSRRGMLVMATGTGKTKTACFIGRRYARVFWLAGQIKLVEQARDAWKEMHPGTSCGIVQASANEYEADHLFLSLQTMSGERLAQVLERGYPDLLVVDECHHAASAAYRKVIAALTGPTTRVLGLTATPDREDAARLSDDWDVTYSYTILDGLRDGALIWPFAALDPIPNLDLRDVGGRKDYAAPELEAALLRAHVVEHTVAAVQKLHQAYRLPFRDDVRQMSAAGQGGLVFTATVEQARLTAEALRAVGINARYVSAKTPKTERRRLLDAFEAGHIDVLCNAVLLTEGVDIPRAQWCILARPTKSWSLYVQMVGRVLRPFGEQDAALIIDLVGATNAHSIVAAPVLVDGHDCPDAGDGVHRFLALETGEGRCHHCGLLIRCFASLGPHKFVNGVCRKCGATQCAESPDFMHPWIPWEDQQRKCALCGVLINDPAARFSKPPRSREPIAMAELLGLPGKVYAANLGAVGVIFNVDAGGGMFAPLWATRDRVHRLSSGPVDARMSRALLEDVCRRAERVNGKYGGAKTERDFNRNALDARKTAAKHNVWRYATKETS